MILSVLYLIITVIIMTEEKKTKVAAGAIATSRHNINTIVVGGGHAGVNLACMLELERPGDPDYLVLERASRLLPKWHHSRWQGFQLNTPVKYGRLYGQTCDVGKRADTMLDRPIQEDLQFWDDHIAMVGVKHKLHSNVVKVIKIKDDDDNDECLGFRVVVEETNKGSSTTTRSRSSLVEYTCQNLVVCNGMYDKPKIPQQFHGQLATIKQHVPAGFQFDQLQAGNTLIVGCGQSGCQIADLLANNVPDNKVYICTSHVSGAPRNIQGKDLFDWLEEMQFLTIPRAALDQMPPEKSRAMKYAKVPVTGPNRDISPFSLHRKGVTLLGSLDQITQEKSNDGNIVFHLKDNRGSNLQACLAGYNKVKDMIVAHAKLSNVPNAPEWSNIEPDLLKETGPSSLGATEHDITNILWCTGWSNDFSWLTNTIVESRDDMDAITHAPDVIVSKSVPGLFYCGFPWIGTQQSQNLVKFNIDTRVIMENLL
jgi:hypothetical protein